MIIALVSLSQIWQDKEKNIKLCKHYISEAVTQQSDLIIFPEMTLTGFTMMDASVYSENISDSMTLAFFNRESKKNKIGIIFGLITRGKNTLENKLIFLNKLGEIVCDYNKIHPFSHANENDYFECGMEVKNTSFGGVKWGLSICYDLRFPEIFQMLSKKAEIIVNIANWPMKRVHHWKILIQARAIENQVYFIGVNRTGNDGNGLIYRESSMIVNPNGIIEKEVYINSNFKIYDIDTSLVEKIRNSFPVKMDRKEELYKKLLEC